MKDLSDLEQYVSKKNLPDKEIEIFWYGWKAAMENSLKNKYNENNSFSHQMDVQKTSDLLNEYQKNRRFDFIIDVIQQSMIKHINILMENDIDLYHQRIILTHIKRWKKIKVNFPNILNIEIVPVKFIHFEIFHNINKNEKLTCSVKRTMLDHIIFNDINKLIDMAINYNEANILVKINEFENIYTYINEKYNTNFYNNTKPSKILKKISNKI